MQPEIIAVGHLCMDEIYLCENFPEERRSTHILESVRQPGGTACQAVVAAARLGARVGYMSPLGDDETGAALYRSCEDEGVDLSFCRVDPGVQSHFTAVLVNANRDTRTFCSYHGKFAPMTFGEGEIRYLSRAKILHLDNTRSDNALAAAAIAKAHGVLVSLDGASLDRDGRKNWELAEMADILITNDTYPLRLTGLTDWRQALLAMGRRLRPRVLLSTRGEEGCVLCQDGALREFSAFSVQPVDTTGAGDAFHGAFLFGWLRGYELTYNIRFASAVAALSCLAPGGRAGLPTLAQAEAFLREHDGRQT